jgi:hypothetical protein
MTLISIVPVLFVAVPFIFLYQSVVTVELNFDPGEAFSVTVPTPGRTIEAFVGTIRDSIPLWADKCQN